MLKQHLVFIGKVTFNIKIVPVVPANKMKIPFQTFYNGERECMRERASKNKEKKKSESLLFVWRKKNITTCVWHPISSPAIWIYELKPSRMSAFELEDSITRLTLSLTLSRNIFSNGPQYLNSEMRMSTVKLNLKCQFFFSS